MTEPRDALEALRVYLLTNAPACDRLAEIEDPDAFVAAAAQTAHDAGIALSRDAIATACRPDPLGLDRFDLSPATQAQWPGPAWLPAEIGSDGTAAVVIWRHFAGLPLKRAFFADTLGQIHMRAINRLLPVRTPLSKFATDMPAADARAPTGLIFHMSRCGSTLVAQMLAAVPGLTVVSEPAPFDAVLQYAQFTADLAFEERVALVRAMAAALGRERSGTPERYVIKLDSWHTLALPLLRAAFPNTPWIFLFRDPTEVMVSQMAMRGLQTVPGMMDARVYGVAIEDAVALSAEDYCALVLAKVCDAVIARRDTGGGLLIDYVELPEAVERRILPHFGIAPDAAGLAALRTAGTSDAKRAGMPFTSDSAAKQRRATSAIRAAVAHRLEAPWRQLLALANDR